jgi:hypothetical protein
MKTVLFCFVGRVDNNSVHFGSGYLFCSDQLESYSWCGFNDLPRGGLSVHDENCGLWFCCDLWRHQGPTELTRVTRKTRFFTDFLNPLSVLGFVLGVALDCGPGVRQNKIRFLKEKYFSRLLNPTRTPRISNISLAI